MKNSSPLFSIIIPTYNRAQLLKKAIESVIHQSFKDWELIIVIDGSTDETVKVIESFSDPRIHYLFQENTGRGAVRNTGIKEACGRYITFLDDDDFYLPEHLQTIEQVIKSAGCPVANIKTEGYLENESGERSGFAMCPDFFPDAMQFVWINGASPMFFTFHRTILEQIQFDSRFNYAQDFHLAIKAMLTFPTLFTRQRTVVLFDHEQRSTAQLSPDKLDEMIRSKLGVVFDLIKNHHDSIRRYLSEKRIRKKIGMEYMYLAHKTARLGKAGTTFNLLFHALQNDLSSRSVYRAATALYHLLNRNLLS